MSAVINYIKGSFKEFKDNVEFPSWNDLSSSTIVVAVATVIIALFLFGIDEVFRIAMSNLYTILYSLVAGN